MGVHQRAGAAFSLVELVIALGIVSFAMVGLIGLLPIGLTTSREAINTTVESQIVQSLSSDLLITDFSNLKNAEFFYNEQASPVSPSDPTLVYTVRMTPQPLKSPAALSENAARSILLEVSNRFASRAKNSYNVIVANNNR